MSEINPAPESWNSETLWTCEGSFDWDGVLQVKAKGQNPMYNNELGYITKASFKIESFGKLIKLK